MEKRTLFIGGGVAVAVLVLYLYARSRSASGPDESTGDEGDALGAGTLLFTPPPPLAAPGAGNWDSTNVPDAATMPGAGGASALTTALQSQDAADTAAKLELGRAALLSQLSAAVLANTPNSQIGQIAIRFDGSNGINITRTAPNVQYFEAWSTPNTSGDQLWTSRAGATAINHNGQVTVTGTDGTSYTQDQVNAWGSAMEAQGRSAEIYDTLKAKGVSLDSYDLLRGRVAGNFSTDTAEAWAIAAGRTVF
jgi:hypothetical protein